MRFGILAGMPMGLKRPFFNIFFGVYHQNFWVYGNDFREPSSFERNSTGEVNPGPVQRRHLPGPGFVCFRRCPGRDHYLNFDELSSNLLHKIPLRKNTDGDMHRSLG